MKKLVAWLVCLLMAGGLAAQDGKDAPPIQVVLELIDGSHLIGTPAVDRFKVETRYATVEVPLSRMRAIEISGADHAAQVSFQNGDSLSGQMAVKEIALKTVFGPTVIPIAAVKEIRARGGSAAFPEGLVLYYSFDPAMAGKTVDKSGSGNDGTIQGATFESGDKFGGALSFNGTRQAVIAKKPSKMETQDFTIMAWVRRGSLEKASNTWPDGVIFGWGHGGYGLAMHSDGSLYLTKMMVDCSPTSCAITDKDLHHVAATRKGSKVVFYVDGVAHPAADYAPNFEFDSAVVAVGAIADDNQEAGFLGQINEVAVFNRPLSDDEIKSVYESQK